jgi:hypothetical protein
MLLVRVAADDLRSFDSFFVEPVGHVAAATAATEDFDVRVSDYDFLILSHRFTCVSVSVVILSTSYSVCPLIPGFLIYKYCD